MTIQDKDMDMDMDTDDGPLDSQGRGGQTQALASFGKLRGGVCKV
jgi:hypothetical protein